MGLPSRTDPAMLFERLGTRRLLFVSGKGGVGRTTIAAMLGLALARPGRRVLVATTGHDDRLAWMLGANELSDVPAEVAPNLFIQRLVPSTCAEEYGTLVMHSQRLSHAVFGNKVVRRLLRAIPGFDDFAVLGKVWHEAVRARSHDVIVFDGPASGHLRMVLGVPDAIVETLSDGPLTREAAAISEALRDPAISLAVLVGLPEPWPLTELRELARGLEGEIGLAIGAQVVNKVWPNDLPELPPPALAPDAELGVMFGALAAVRERGREQAAVIEAWLSEEGSSARGDSDSGQREWLSVPWWPWGVDGAERLRELLDATVKGRDAAG